MSFANKRKSKLKKRASNLSNVSNKQYSDEIFDISDHPNEANESINEQPPSKLFQANRNSSDNWFEDQRNFTYA